MLPDMHYVWEMPTPAAETLNGRMAVLGFASLLAIEHCEGLCLVLRAHNV